MKDQTRNLNPSPEARWAMRLWSNEYAAQCGDSMDFWDGLTEYRKKLCQEIVASKPRTYTEVCKNDKCPRGGKPVEILYE